MSAIEPIKVDPATLTEPVRYEIMRLNELDVRHAMAHKADGIPDGCIECRRLPSRIRSIVHGGPTPELDLIERTAMTLARQANASIVPPDDIGGYWDGVLDNDARDYYRDNAVEILTELGLISS